MSENSIPPRRMHPTIPFTLGFLTAAAIAAVLYLVLIDQERDRILIDLKALQQGANPQDLLKGVVGDIQLPAPGVKLTLGTPESKVMEVGKEFVKDIENNRLASAFRTLSSAYQAKLDRQKFDEMIAKVPQVRRLSSSIPSRDCKVRKLGEGKAYDFFFTGRDNYAESGKDLVNFALTFTQENGEWRVEEMEITAEGK